MIRVMTPSFQINTPQYDNAIKKKTNRILLSEKQDSFKSTTKPEISNSKKVLTAGLSIMGAIVLTASVVSLIQKNQLKNIQKEGSKIHESAKKFQTAAQDLVNEVLASFDNVKTSKDGTKVIEKFADDGKTLLSKSSLNNGFLTIDNFSEKTRIEARDGALSGFYRGVEFLGDGSIKAKESFNILYGRVLNWAKNIQENTDGSWSAKKKIFFLDEDGRIFSYMKKPQNNAFCRWKINLS